MMQDHYAEDALALAVRKIVQEISLPPGDLLLASPAVALQRPRP